MEPWECSNCGQMNANWAESCGRCGGYKDLMKPEGVGLARKAYESCKNKKWEDMNDEETGTLFNHYLAGYQGIGRETS